MPPRRIRVFFWQRASGHGSLMKQMVVLSRLSLFPTAVIGLCTSDGSTTEEQCRGGSVQFNRHHGVWRAAEVWLLVPMLLILQQSITCPKPFPRGVYLEPRTNARTLKSYVARFSDDKCCVLRHTVCHLH